MDKEQARQLVKETFEKSFKRDKFIVFIKNLLNEYEPAEFIQQGNYIKDSFKPFISKYERIGKYKDENKTLDILIVYLRKETSLERARTMQRNFISWYLNGGRGDVLRDASLVAFVSPDSTDWRFSLVKMDYKFETTNSGKTKVREEFTSAYRWSFLVGPIEKSHTAQSRLVPIIEDDNNNPTLKQLEEAFNIEKVTKEFFIKYRDLFLWTRETLDEIVRNDKNVKKDFEDKNINTVDFSKKLLGQIVFLYFLQKKGWFGVSKSKNWGEGSKVFLRELFSKKHCNYDNFFNDILEPLFYEALRIDRTHDDNYYSRFNCKIPFLNGGLFDPINNYNWVNTEILLPNNLFSNTFKTSEGDIGNGILDVFDRYNFTVKEDEPLEKEIAVDPEMLGKVFENLLEVKDRKSKGSYYTPREIVHYMCQQSLVNYLYNEINKGSNSITRFGSKQTQIFGNEINKGQLEILVERFENVNILKKDIEDLIYYGEQWKEHDSRVMMTGKETNTYPFRISDNIRKYAGEIDKKLYDIKVCDPAVGSGAFPVGLMAEIVKARDVLTYFIADKNRSLYDFKRECIENSLYGVDIDQSAVEITKLRLWLSLVVDEDDFKTIQPLPNLDYKIVCGNSLMGLPDGVLLNDDCVNRLEKLKIDHLNSTNPVVKNKLKKDIDELIAILIKDALNFLPNKLNVKFDFHIYFPEVFHKNKAFDVIITNPPYVGERGHKEIFREIKQGPLKRFYIRKMDLFYFFFHLAINLGKKYSTITLITTNYYLTATGAKKLRDDLKNRTSVKLLINFNELKIFESATGQHNLITVLCRKKDENALCNTCTTRRQGLATPEILNTIINWGDNESEYKSIKNSDLFSGDENYIHIIEKMNSNSYNTILDKIVKQGIKLIKVCNINQGILTGADKVSKKHIDKFPRDKFIKGQGVYVLNKDEIKNIVSIDLLRPFYKNSDIYKYVTNDKTDEYLLYLTRDLNLSNFKDICNHVNRFKKIIKDRPKERGEIQAALKQGKWWVIFAARKTIKFESPKIVVPQRSLQNTFGYNETSWYAASDVFYISQKDSEVSLKYILAVLNSKLIYYWLYNRGKRKGEYLELVAKPISEIPIKKCGEKEQNILINLTDKIIKEKEYNINANTKIFENNIDVTIYKLYGLSYDEVKIVDREIEKIISMDEYERISI